MEADLAEAGEQGKDAVDKLTYDIFSILETKFLFGRGVSSGAGGLPCSRAPGKVCVLSIDGGARPVDGLLAAAALVRLEAALRRRAGGGGGGSKQPQDARLADSFDVAAGSGAGGVLAAMLFARDPRGRPMYSAEDALGFFLRRVRRGSWSASRAGAGGLMALRRRATAFGRVFGELTLRDTVRPVLVPCYDLATRAPFLFSRADAAQSPAHDFRLRDVCAATCAGAAGSAAATVEVTSVDGATRIAAVGSGVALGNPTAAAITHVLNNRREFPGAATIDDLLVISIGTGDAVAVSAGGRSKPPEMARIAAEGVSDMVDQAVAMAFGQSRTSNYIRIQGTGARRGGGRAPRTACGGETKEQAVWKAEAMLLQKSVESVLFQGRKLAGETNAEKLERFARELAKEHGRRKQQHTASPGDGQLVSAAAGKQHPTATQNVTATPAATAVVAMPEAAVQAPLPRRRRRTAVRAAAAAGTKRAAQASTSSGPGQ
ncbi:hypothetical protein EJB05_14644, partial [Eragrostis curvula]